MKNKLFIIIVLFFIIQSFAVGQGLILNFVNRQLTGNTWTFDVEGVAGTEYIGTNDNWSTMNVRFDIVVPSGVIFVAPYSGVPNPAYASTAGAQIAVPGAPPEGSIEFGITLDRNAGLPDLSTTPAILGTFTFTFSNSVPSSNLITPRPVANISGSFYTTLEDATTRRPFILPVNFTVVSALPINLTDFTAQKYNQNSSLLRWTTFSEISFDYYGIERSLNSRSWEKIGSVKAKGDSKSKVSYEFIDDNITLSRSKENIYYYRLRMVDRDGQFTYSEIRDVDFGRLKTPDLIIHPNPTNDIINLDLTIFDKNDGPIEITVYDMNGKLVLSRITTDTGSEIVDISSLPANTYNIKVKQGELIYNEKVIKVD